MKLRSRLALAFALLAWVPLLVVVPWALQRLRNTLDRELQVRMEGAVHIAQQTLSYATQSAERALDELAHSETLEDYARGQPIAADSASTLMRSRGLTVLALFGTEGRTLSSGHLPARRGDVDPSLFAACKASPQPPHVLWVEVAAPQGLHQVPAQVSSRWVKGERGALCLLGGLLLDEALLSQLSTLTLAELQWLPRPPLASQTDERTLQVGEGLWLKLRMSRAAAVEAEAGVAKAFLLLAALGLGLAILLGLGLAARITRPVEALTRGAQRVAAGELDVQVQASATGEVRTLVQSFNAMTQQLRQTTARLVQSERVAAWQEVARRLAHEIKNPLTPIQMSLETLKAAHQAKNPRFDALFPESAALVLEEVARLKKIVDAFSRFARAPKPERQPLDLTELVQGQLALHAAWPPGIALHRELSPGVRTLADRDQLIQVLSNLLKNAQEALSPQGGHLTVRVRAEGGHALLEVEDTGPGIAVALKDRLFEPYVTTKPEGNGLGLAICAGIANEHEGSLAALEVPTGGTCFRLTLPRLS